MVFYSNVYYIIILAWALHYFFASFTTSSLPWSTCGNWWNTDNCITMTDNKEINDLNRNATNAVDSVVEYWE